MPTKKQSQKNESLNFEEAIERLENIIDKMEGERIPLEELLKDYEEGTKLLNACKEKINTAKEKVEKINKSLNEDMPSLDPLDEGIDKGEQKVTNPHFLAHNINKQVKLSEIKSPEDLKALPEEDLNALAALIRKDLIESLSQTGGHLGPNLGVVELTIALHRVFETPKDKFVFDVSHQGYVHKMLTGRWNKIDTIRQYKGLMGFF